MRIDFTMGGVNISLLIGLVVLLQGICLLIFQNPIKKIKHFGIRDYIILGIILLMIAAGIFLMIAGIVSTVRPV